MNIRHLTGVVVVTLITLAAPAPAAINSPTLLFETPTADVLPAGALAISADGSYPLVQTPQNVNYFEANANIRFSPLKHLDFAVTAYTFADYVLDAKYQILGGEPDHFGLAVGVYDVGFNSYVSPIGHGLDDAWPDWKYNKYLPRYNRQYERFSAFVVTSIPVTKFARLHLGLGRGRFVGYDRRSKYLNIDQFFDEYHQWAFGLFGGAEVYVTPKVALIASASGRDMNSGVKANFGAFTATVAWMKMEGLLFSKGDDRFGRIQAGLTYQFNNLCQHQESDIPLYHVAPAPEPAPAPTLPPVAARTRLNPIWFKCDKWDITSDAAATLRQNADVLLAHPDMKIVINGYASEEGTLEHNLPLSGRRASTAYAYLQSLGVPAGQMRFQGMGESTGTPLPMHRSVYFETEK